MRLLTCVYGIVLNLTQVPPILMCALNHAQYIANHSDANLYSENEFTYVLKNYPFINFKLLLAYACLQCTIFWFLSEP